MRKDKEGRKIIIHPGCCFVIFHLYPPKEKGQKKIKLIRKDEKRRIRAKQHQGVPYQPLLIDLTLQSHIIFSQTTIILPFYNRKDVHIEACNDIILGDVLVHTRLGMYSTASVDVKFSSYKVFIQVWFFGCVL